MSGRELARIASALFVLSTVACDDGRTPDPIVDPPTTLPKIARFTADRGAVRPGETVQLSWKVSDADTVEIAPDVYPAQPVLEGMVTTPPIHEPTTFTLRARSAAGVDQRSISISVPTSSSAPEIVSFTATPPVVAMGAESVLAWQVERAMSIRLQVKGGGVLVPEAMARGSVPVQPMQSTRFVLIAEGRGLTVEREVEVVVGKTPSITSFTAAPEEIRSGETAQLTWTVEDATRVRILDPQGQVVIDTTDAQGSTGVAPRATTEYRLEASNDIGATDTRATVRVMGAEPPVIDEFSVTPLTLLGPGMVTVRWSATRADRVTLSAGGAMVPGFPGGAMGSFDVGVAATTEIELVASNAVGQDTERASVTVMPIPDGTPPQLEHTPVMVAQTAGSPIRIDATASDADSGLQGVTLFYRATGALSFDSVALTGQGAAYSGDIPAIAVTVAGVDYYLEARDNAGTPNVATHPTGAPAMFHTIPVVAQDLAPPVITHTTIANGQLAGATVNIAATITDVGSGVGAANLFYRRQGGMFTSRTMMAMAGDRYSADIPANVITAGTIEYYIQAVDAASPANGATSPMGAPTSFHAFTVTPVDGVPPVIQHTPIAAAQTTGGAVQVNAIVTDASGVARVTLFYRTQGAMSFDSLAMSGAGGNYSASIPAVSVQTPAVEYYLEAADAANPMNVGRNPAGAPGAPHSFPVVMADMNPPQITHTQVSSPRSPGVAVNVNATITDASPITSAQLFYRRVGAMSFTTLPLSGGPSYVGVIPANDVEPPGIEYYLRAADGAPAANAGTSPQTAPAALFSFTIGVSENEPNGAIAQATPFIGAGRLTSQAFGAISPTADRDYWIVDVPAGGPRYNLRAEITAGGPGLCPAPVATVLRLYAADGTTQLASDSFDGVGSCSLLDPAVDTGARALAAGRYYLRVEESGENATIGAYELSVALEAVRCGNGILEAPAGEQCDDGNGMAGDGCSATCAIEPEGTITPPSGVFSGDISPAGDQDLVAVDLPSAMFLRAEVTDAAGTACPGDALLDLLAADGSTVLGTDDDDGVGLCPLINPTVDAFARSLAAGRYFLRVRGLNGTTTFNGYRLRVTLTAGLCGNGTRETGEQCDDSNASNGDGCSDLCQFETVGTAMGAGASFSDGITPIRNIDYYAVVVQAGQSIRAETFVPTTGQCTVGNDTVLRFWSPDRATELGSDDQSGIESCSVLDPANDLEMRNLAAGTYWISVEEYQNNATIAAYTLDIQIRQPGCGNGWLDGADQCDDGGTMAGDGCSATCQFEGPAETEPNNSSATATVLRAGADPEERALLGSLSSGTDIDVYSVVVPAQYSLFAEISDGMGGCPNNASLRLVGTDGTTSLVLDTADGPGSCGQISPTRDAPARFMAAGTYYLRVEGTGGAAAYRLQVRVTAPSCGDGFLSMGEACDDANTMSGDGCSASCAIEGAAEVEPNNTTAAATPLITTSSAGAVRGVLSATTDVDVYSVVVPQGAHVIAEVSDGRGRCPNGASLRLRSPSGTSLVTDPTDGPDGCGRIAAGLDSAARNLTAGTYFVEVYTTAGSVSPTTYHLDVRVVPGNACGNFYAEGAEQCDDGNAASGDGCSASCTWEHDEVEPNGSFANANAIPASIRYVHGAITSGDEDWFSVAVPQGAALTIRTTAGARDQCGAGQDSIVTLFGPDGSTELASDDDDAAGTCSVIEASEASNLAAGTYYVRVTPFQTSTFASYGLLITVHPN